MTIKIKLSDLDNILARYISGEHENKLAQEFGFGRNVIRRHIINAGIKPRGISESLVIRWKNAPESERISMLANAHIARRGSVVSESTKVLHAKTLQSTHVITGYELQLTNWLKERGISITNQKAVGIYNLDIAINRFPIAVEMFGGGWHAYGSHKERFFSRSKYLFDHGWSMIVVWIDRRRYPLTVNCADYIIKYIDIFSKNPPAISEYGVILGNGNSATIRNTYFNTPAIIEGFGNCKYIT